MLVTLTVPVSSLVVGLGGLVAVRSPARGRPAGSDAERVEVVVEEHHDYAQVIDAPDAPFLNWLAQRGALLRGYFGGRPDSRAMLDGDALDVDCPESAPNLVDRLETAGISWAAYLHSPPTCPNAFDSIRCDPQRCKRVVPFERFAADLTARRLPQLVFVAPDLRDGSVAAADAWLLDLCRPLATSTACGGGDTRLVATFDESPAYSPLRATEEEVGLGCLGLDLDLGAEATTIPATIG